VATTPAPGVEVGAPLLYETNTTVLEDETDGPRLCLGLVALSLPPQCGGVPIANWDWDKVTGEETAGEAPYQGTWGVYHVVGTYDGETFTLVEAGPEEPIEPVGTVEDSKDKPACDMPPGGWVVPTRGRTTDEDSGDVGAWAATRPEYVAAWVTYLDPNVGAKFDAGDEGPFPVIFSIVVNDNAPAVEAEARKRWDGPLCVVERDVLTEKEAMAIRAEAEASLEEYGLVFAGSSEGELGEAAEIWVAADPGGAGQAIMDERFGDGVIRLVPQLIPVN
jgi:hypothetical protein